MDINLTQPSVWYFEIGGIAKTIRFSNTSCKDGHVKQKERLVMGLNGQSTFKLHLKVRQIKAGIPDLN